MIRDFILLLFPKICAACGKVINKSENTICTYCRIHLPKTDYHLYNDNPVSRLFWGKTDIFASTAYYYFRKGSRVQQLIHKLKYLGQSNIGITIGKFMGADLVKETVFNSIDCIIPVPLHPLKLRKRGYNQSDYIGMGLAESMGKPCITNNLYRAISNASQTRKSQWDRFQNVEGIFRLKAPAELKNKHVLLTDDVVTTGSTLVACSEALHTVPGIKVSVAAIACAIQ